jgi:hypothetical protein
MRARITIAGWVVAAAAVFAVLASLAIAFGSPPFLTGDEVAHIDYAVELWHGHLPVFERGMQIHQTFGPVVLVQIAAQHPPLFYAIAAPFVGPLWDSGHQYEAVIAGRSVSAVFSGLVVVASAWAAARVLPGRPAVAATTSVVVAGSGMFLLVGGAAYNDLPAVFFSALAVGIAASALRRGLSVRLVVLGTVVGTLGMLSRFSFIALFVGLVAAFALAPWTSARGAERARGRGVVAHVLGVASVVVVAALGAGWFYLRNLRLTGNVQGSHVAYAEQNLDRHTFGFVDSITTPSMWARMFGLYRGHLPSDTPVQWVLLLVPAALAVAVLVLVVARRRRAAGAGEDTARDLDDGRWPRNALVAAMLTGVAGVVVFSQIEFWMNGGAANARYLLPALPVFAIVMAIGLTGLGRVVAAAVSGAWTLGVIWVWALIPNLLTPSAAAAHALDLTRLCFGAAIVVAIAMIVLLVLMLGRRRAPLPV